MDSPVKDNINECWLPLVLLYPVCCIFTFSCWGSAGVGAWVGVSTSTSVSVSFHAAGAAPAAPAPSAGPHATWRAARVRARLANATAAPLGGALSSDTSRIHTCCTSETSETESKHVVGAAAELGGPPFCLRQLSVPGPDSGASDLVLLQQWLLLRAPLLLRSPVFHSRSFSLSGITTTSCSGALQQW